MTKKITIIGAGSLLFTPGLIKNCLLSQSLRDYELVLFDPDYEMAEVMYKLGLKMNSIIKSGMVLTLEKSREKALEGASFVFLSINVGGFKRHIEDIEVPQSYGILQSVGDTVGPGGIFRTLRFVPAVLDICREMERVCPKAYLISFTNPMTTIIQAVFRHTKIKPIGLCHDFINTVKELEDLFQVAKDSLKLNYAGLNHCVWLIDIEYKGKNMYQHLKDVLERNKAPKNLKCRLELFKIFGYMPAGGEKHVVEFFPYFLKKDINFGNKWGIKLRLDALKSMMREREHTYKKIINQVKGSEPFKDIHSPSRERGVEIIESMINDESKVFNINTINTGTVNNMPIGSVLEVAVVVNSRGLFIQPTKNIPEIVLGNALSYSLELKMAADAAAMGDRKKAFQSLMLDPAVNNIKHAEEMFNKMMKLQDDYLGYLK